MEDIITAETPCTSGTLAYRLVGEGGFDRGSWEAMHSPTGKKSCVSGSGSKRGCPCQWRTSVWGFDSGSGWGSCQYHFSTNLYQEQEKD